MTFSDVFPISPIVPENTLIILNITMKHVITLDSVKPSQREPRK